MVNILVVDDSRVERCLAGTLIAKRPEFKIHFAENGKQALEKMRRAPPNLVVTDLVMPEMDGLELVRTVRQEFPDIPVILMTAYGNESLAVDALEQGAASYVPKAKQAERLLETVERVLARTQANRRHDKLTKCLGKIDATFYLDNDPEMIAPLVDSVQKLVGGLEISDEAQRIRAGVALEEALVNAAYHGNLELTSEELDQARAAGGDALKKLVQQRRSTQPYCDRRTILEVHVTSNTARFVVRDSGPGFNHAAARRQAMSDRFERGTGCGITVMNMLMDEVAYNEIGNEVTLIKLTDGD